MSDIHTSNNKRLAKNTLVLYMRMFFSLAIQLFTSRLVLQALGVEDYGIYNVVGGVVTVLSFINMSLSNANARFIAVDLVSNDTSALNRLFSCIVTIHYVFAIVILLLAETVGLWFVINKLVIPPDRMTAAIVTYQCSVLSALFAIISSPYNGLIIAHERMSAFAIISILDTVAKFAIALLLFIIPFDKLILYSFFHVFIQVSIRCIYVIYCRKNFIESKYKITWDKEVSRNIISFAGWTLTGNMAVVGYTQGLNILLNLFFGAVVNAARGVSMQVQSAARMFCTSFQTAINPQIMKSYSSGDFNRMHKLVILSSRLSYYLMLLISLPLCMHTQYILELWLGDVPEYSAGFVQVMLIVGLIHTLQNPTMTALHATGDIKKVQIVESSLLLSVVPLAYISLKFFSVQPIFVYIVYFFVELVTQFVRVIMIYPKVRIQIKQYFTEVLSHIIAVTAIAFFVAILISKNYIVNSLSKLIIVTCLYILSTLIIVYLFGITNKERSQVSVFVKQALKKFNLFPR